jgi:hypothetical protein
MQINIIIIIIIIIIISNNNSINILDAPVLRKVLAHGICDTEIAVSSATKCPLNTTADDTKDVCLPGVPMGNAD